MEVKKVRPSDPNSYERLMHDSGRSCFLLDFSRHDALQLELRKSRIERFIGVIYRPETELLSHYADACLPKQFDAYVWIDETHAVTPLQPGYAKPGSLPDTYPFAV